MAKKYETLVDEGFRISLVEKAFFDGVFEIPHIDAPKEIVIPKGMVPFSVRERSLGFEDFVCFYENDVNFRDILTHTEDYVEDLKRFPGVVSPDCSLYIDAPLCVQISDIYLNRAIGYYLSQQGIYVIPNIRWGDERTYTDELFGEKVAFQGVDKHSIVSVGTYGQIQSSESKRYFREGLMEMLKELEPEVVLVYGSMNDYIFNDLKDKTQFVQFPDWITRKKEAFKEHLKDLLQNASLCCKAYNDGVDMHEATSRPIAEGLKSGFEGYYALIAQDEDVLMNVTNEEHPLRKLLEHKKIPTETDKYDELCDMINAIVENDSDAFNEALSARIRSIRKMPTDYFICLDVWSMGLIRYAEKQGMIVDRDKYIETDLSSIGL